MLYPIGQQDFADIRQREFVYVDKTALVYKLAMEGKFYFLSRPRRFGKSLLLSTLKNYFLGNKELFQGLAIEQLETEWLQYPVLSLTLGKGEYATLDDLQGWLDFQIACWEKQYHCEDNKSTLAVRFSHVIQCAYEQTGRQVVILIDEYDAPLQATLDKPELMELYQSKLRDLYLCLKNNDEYIRFAFLTGITAWGKMGVFSTLNNLDDISLSEEYATLCGITEEELHDIFHEEVTVLAEKNSLTADEAYQRLKEQYDGYHFAENATGVYNPFSLLNALKYKNLNNYWVRTGETQVVAALAQKVKFDIDTLLLGNVSMSEENMLNNKNPLDNPYTFLFQAGYLTLNGRDPATKKYRLRIPNGEVRGSLANHLVAPTFGFSQQEASSFIDNIKTAMYYGRMDELVATLNDYIFRKENYVFKGKADENYFQHILYLVFLSADYEVAAEVKGHIGRADLVVKTEFNIYVIETKLDGSAQEALCQINEKGYADPYATDPRPLVKLGLNFSATERIIDDYAVEQ